MSKPKLQIGVIGAGAAGFFAAIHAAGPGREVTILEKTSKVLSKVKISGGGRCNVTHAAFHNSQLVKNYPRGGNFLKKVFQHFSVNDCIDWFEKRGVKLKIEADGRMFPITDSSQTIIDALFEAANENGVKIIYRFPVHEIKIVQNGFLVKSENEERYFDRLIVCTGGSPKIDGFNFIGALGHKIVPPVPSLFTFNTPHEPIKQLMGISLPEALVKLEGTKLTYSGPLLITHWGISGPAVLKLSAFGANWMADQQYRVKAHIRWHKDWTESFLAEQLKAFSGKHPAKKVITNPLFGLPARLWEHLCLIAEVKENLLWREISKKQWNKLIQNLFCYIVRVEGKTTFKEEFVTAGGVDLSEIDPQTMESKIVKGLFFAGEVLNIDGVTGGFNFQSAWSTGYLAGVSTNQ